MIGVSKREKDGTYAFPDPLGMLETLVENGFSLENPGTPGKVHFERYWHSAAVE